MGGGVILKNIRQLILPYVVISIFTSIYFVLFRDHAEVLLRELLLGTTITNNYSVVLGPVWFLLALFWCRILYRFLAENTSLTYIAIIILLLSMGMVLMNKVWCMYQVPYELTQGCVGLFYYHMGVTFRNGQWDFLSKLTYKKTLLGLSSVILLVGVVYYKFQGVNMNISALQFPLFPIDMINSGLFVILLYLVVEYGVRHNHCLSLTKFLIWFGRNSMVVYFIHCLEYHTSLPLYPKIIEASSLEGALRSFAYSMNPVIQTLICIMGLCLYEFWGNRKSHIA